MKTVVTNPKEIQRLLKQQRQTPKSRGKRVYKVVNANELRTLAYMLDIQVPSGSGRLPIERVREALQSQGHDLDDSEYRSGSADPKRYYEVNAVVKEGKFYVPKTVVMGIAQLRDHHRALGLRGRPSHSNIAEATATANNWVDYTIVSVEMLR